ncbi:ABC transporter permease [Maledivibacter halophilus]|uniref:Nucleoside ABC transporter membrane protein n=1 Tax=Maledivibacter halophilus TaxID=36842 RepID=A0A1T5J736_9FIRM|nr:ABC transporter permease [Maledivibacter halophilus]SKC47043.1 nucleoside ABC transporter membrane protein [Maledivibacter halophilus]
MRKELRESLLRLLIAFGVALIVSSVFILSTGENPLLAYIQLLKGAFVGKLNIVTTLRWSVPYIITGVAAAIAFRAGMFNLGIDGCVYLGGLTAALIGTYVKGLPLLLHILLAVFAAMFVGALWLYIPAKLRAYHGVNEVITTWMLSYTAILLCQFLVGEIFQDPNDLSQAAQQVRTSYIQETAKLSQLFPPYQLNASIFIAIGLIILFYIFVKRTTHGYEHTIVGEAPDFAQYGGVDVAKTRFYSIVVSGAVGALAGATEILGVHYRYIHGFSNELGSSGILVALMGRLNPLGIPLSGIFMGAMQNGARGMSRTSNVSLDTVRIMIAVVVICITADGLYELLKVKSKVREEE